MYATSVITNIFDRLVIIEFEYWLKNIRRQSYKMHLILIKVHCLNIDPNFATVSFQLKKCTVKEFKTNSLFLSLNFFYRLIPGFICFGLTFPWPCLPYCPSSTSPWGREWFADIVRHISSEADTSDDVEPASSIKFIIWWKSYKINLVL